MTAHHCLFPPEPNFPGPQTPIPKTCISWPWPGIWPLIQVPPPLPGQGRSLQAPGRPAGAGLGDGVLSSWCSKWPPPPSPVQLPARACFLSFPSTPWAGEGARSGGHRKRTELGVQAGLGNSQLEMELGRRTRGGPRTQPEGQTEGAAPRGVRTMGNFKAQRCCSFPPPPTHTQYKQELERDLSHRQRPT